MTQPFYLNNIALAEPKGVSATDGFPHYLYDISTTSLNSQMFRISQQTLDSITRQANAGVPIYKSHRTYSQDPSGYTVSAERKGHKVQAELYIQPNLPDVDTDSLIARMDARTMRDGSISFLGGAFHCDIDNSLFKLKDDGWWYSFKCESGHRLGQELDDSKIVTAQVKGEVSLREFSITGRGSDPGAGIVKKLHDEFGSEPIDAGVLSALAEVNNFDIGSFCQHLGFQEYERQKSFSFPTPLGAVHNRADNPDREFRENNRQAARLTEEIAQWRQMPM